MCFGPFEKNCVFDQPIERLAFDVEVLEVTTKEAQVFDDFLYIFVASGRIQIF